ncbi:MAG: Ig-like domain-containing protein [Spirochaetia bacterium]|nr:Ig-like domain-containing protein [Spirochaetia bacterium]
MNKKRNIFVTAMAVMLAAVFFACKEPVPVTGVTLDKTALTLTPGDTSVLKATVDPENATVQTVTWSAEPAGVVTLKAEGNGCAVTAVKTGTATVTVTTADGVKTAQCEVSIVDAYEIINSDFVKAVDTQCGWTKKSDDTVEMTPENQEAARAVTKLDISFQELTDISGIKWFSGLTNLKCSYNQLTSLDVSANTALETLYCDSNQLTSLDVSVNMALEDLSCNNNLLRSLDVSANTALEDLYCDDNQLTELNVSANTALRYLACDNNQLTELDMSANTVLLGLWCGNQTSDGGTPLILHLNEDQKTTWENEWKSAYPNDQNVVLAQ